jgi:hypothetical protein
VKGWNPSGYALEFFNNTSKKWEAWSLPGAVVPADPYTSFEQVQDELHPGPPYRSGGPFIRLKADLGRFSVKGIGIYEAKDPWFISGLGFQKIRYRGGFYNPVWTGGDPYQTLYVNGGVLLSTPALVPELTAYYPEAAKLRPKIEQASLGQAIAEAREIPQMIRQASKGFSDIWKGLGGGSHDPFMSPKRLADEFLGIQFGWFPFVKDVNDALRLSINYKDYVDDLIRRNNRWDHMARVIENTESERVILKGSGSRVSPWGAPFDAMCVPDSHGDTASWEIKSRVKTLVWVAGDYRFYLPEFDPSDLNFDTNWYAVKRLMTLSGTRVNPSLLWKITPWSWLVDWFTNAGNVIDNLVSASQDGVVSKNLYLMHHRIEELVFTQTFNFFSGARSVSWSRVIDTKQRDHAGTPFGFGLSAGSLSGKQWSILGALGISKFL